MSTWSLQEPLRFYDRSEGAVVCYGIDSGDTHLLSETAVQLLQALESGAQQEVELHQRLAGLATLSTPGENPAPDAHLDVIQQLLSDLAGVGLVASS